MTDKRPLSDMLSRAIPSRHGVGLDTNLYAARLGLSRRAVMWGMACASAGLLAGCASSGVSPSETALDQQGNRTDGDGPTGSPVTRGSVKVALLLPQTGDGAIAEIGKHMKQAAEMALFEFDQPGVAVVARDTKGTPEGARIAAEDAIRQGAQLMIGPLLSKSVSEIAPIARSAKVPVIALSSDQTVAGEGIHLLSFLAGRDIPRIVAFAIARGKRRFAALIEQTPYGDIAEQTFRASVQRAGGQVVALERYPLDANAMLTPVQTIANTIKAQAEAPDGAVDALFIPAGPETMGSLAPLLPYFDIDTKVVQLIGTGRWDYPNIGREKILHGGWFPAPDPQGWRDFSTRYVQAYGSPPPRLASIGYDAMSLALALSRGGQFEASQLTRASGFAGVDGLFRLRADGTSDRGLAILEVQQFGARVIEAAPSVFGAAEF